MLFHWTLVHTMYNRSCLLCGPRTSNVYQTQSVFLDYLYRLRLKHRIRNY